MKIISFINQKGGASKTTLCVHLATMFQEIDPNLRIVVADADPQGSATRWLRSNLSGVQCIPVAPDREGRTLKRELALLNADIVFLDLPPQIEALSLRASLYSDIIIIPVGPSLLDIDASRVPIDIGKEAREHDPTTKVILIPTRVRQNTASGRELREVLADMGRVSQATIQMRIAYSDSATAGLGINRYAPESPAYHEMRELAEEIFAETQQ